MNYFINKNAFYANQFDIWVTRGQRVKIFNVAPNMGTCSVY